ncbi:preprotein translocase subunit SecF [Desulfohalotomaculum tongense]|uniref:protein translocase subunit SecF n=1 Tax=Desulforadius tongensis TaxID=1216062 RepID=UPI00195E5C28|nr:protein translocase subunit SecF [Desulforadius tongensis]MBM7855125.1 preprotein translocase subunit SecF [Desulforadius tongensis]
MFHIIHKRKLWYIISAAIIIPGLISLFIQGLNLGIDFTGGNITEVKFKKDVTTAQVREVVKEQGLTDKYIQKSTGGVFLIRTEVLTEEENEKMLKALDEELGGMTLLRNNKVGPTIGAELTRQALLALAVASVLMVLYITWRFEFKQGIAAIAAILHDVLVTVGLLSIMQVEINSAFVAAILTIIGYSINDTIVIFDRIRENLALKKGMKIADVINISLWQTMARSINTTGTVLFVLAALYFFGGTTINNFVLALIIGVTSGAYSSIFTASPLWYDMLDKKRRQKAVKPTA